MIGDLFNLASNITRQTGDLISGTVESLGEFSSAVLAEFGNLFDEIPAKRYDRAAAILRQYQAGEISKSRAKQLLSDLTD